MTSPAAGALQRGTQTRMSDRDDIVIRSGPGAACAAFMNETP